MSWDIFFQSWSAVARVVIVGALAYIALVALLRVLGNRTLAKMNAYDWVVTFALGSTLAATMLSKDVTLVDGVVAFALLMGLEVAITRLSERSPAFRNLVNAEPVLLFYQGRFLRRQMHRARVSVNDVREAIRKHGSDSANDVEAVVLEPDGTFSVVRSSGERANALGDLQPHQPGNGDN